MYATRSDLEKVWGADFVLGLLPEDLAEEPDAAAAIDGALVLAGQEIDTHLSARYSLPLDRAPAVLVTPCANIAVYLLANRHAALTTTIEDRYKQTVELLQRIADGKAGLGADEPRVTSEPDTSAGGAVFVANDRLFTRGGY